MLPSSLANDDETDVSMSIIVKWNIEPISKGMVRDPEYKAAVIRAFLSELCIRSKMEIFLLII